jgi:hypothetical protein
MADDSFVSISDRVWEKWLAAFMIAASRNWREALYEEWPLLMRKVMDFTPPFKTRNLYASSSAAHASDLSVGRKATAFDIYKTMRPFDPKNVRSPALRKIIDSRDLVAFNAIAARSKSPYLAGAEAVAFSPEIHKALRNARGRVPGRDRHNVVLGTDARALNAYVKREQGFVGVAKSGWLKAMNLVGGDAPNYVTKQGTSLGDVIDDHANEENPSITAINRTPWAVRKDEGERILSDAKASRVDAIIAKVKASIFRADQEAKGA